MAIKMACECGKMLTVPDDAAGRRARCPACDAVVKVPGTPPPPPPPPPDASPQPTKVDAMMETFVADLAKSRERAPQLTQIATALLIWAGISFALTFLGSVMSDASGAVIYWILVYVPISVASALLALATIKAWEHTPACVEAASLLIVGASYALFWHAAGPEKPSWWSLFLFVNLVNMAGFAFLYWYFKWHGIAAIFKPETGGASPSPAETPKTSEGTDKK